jgi:hypothetical protein
MRDATHALFATALRRPAKYFLSETEARAWPATQAPAVQTPPNGPPLPVMKQPSR